MSFVQNSYEFFSGILTGAVGRPPMLYSGTRRTAAHLGFATPPAQYDDVWLHNQLTAKALYHGFRFVTFQYPNPAQIQQVWNQLPIPAQQGITNWAFNTTGQMVGGSLVNMGISRALTHKLNLPPRIVFPAMLLVTFQGNMAIIWKDA